MIKTTRTALVVIATVSLAACANNTADTGSDTSASVGGASQQSAASSTTGGSSAKSSTAPKGGAKSTATTSQDETGEGGASFDEGNTEGGTSSTEEGTSEGGTSSTEESSSSGGVSDRTTTGTGGTSSRRTSTKGAGGSNTTASGGASSSSTAVTGATGGTTSTSSSKATGGSATSSTRATGGSATGGAATGGAATGGSSSVSGLAKFSFFVTSYAAMKRLSGSDLGFGGDLRYGQSDGLTGADKICATIAETSMTGAGAKGWKAFISTSTINAIDRITYDGPFYDRRGRVVATSKAGLISGDRPAGADSAIANDLPNEDGVANHAPDGTQVDNHDVLTGSTNKGVKTGFWCSDWTNSSSTGNIQIGHSWPAHGNNWLQAHTVSGCKPGVTFLTNSNAESGANGTVGSMGGYGGIYCLASEP